MKTNTNTQQIDRWQGIERTLTVHFGEVAQRPDGPQLNLRSFTHWHETKYRAKRSANCK